MQAISKYERLQEFEDLCRQQGLPLTVQRRTILEVLLDREDHPTAEQVFDAVESRVPGISRTTVYRVLETLVRVGVVHRICHPGAAARFDPKIHQHHHLVCLHCDRIVDLEDDRLNAVKLPAIDPSGYDIREFRINFRGTCPDCRRKLEKKTPRRAGNKRKKSVKSAKKAGTRSSTSRRKRA